MGRRPPDQECQRSIKREIGRCQRTSVATAARQTEVELGVLSDKEESFTKQTVESKATPSPKLLIKDHKNPDKEGNFPARLAVPATNFTSAFPKTGCLGIKRILDDNKADYMSKTTIQASDLKDNLEDQGTTCNNSTTASTDAEDFYPSVGKTETSEKSSLSLLQRPTRRRSNHHRTLPRPNQVWNAVNTTCFRGQML